MQNYNEDPRKSTGNVTVSAKSSYFSQPSTDVFILFAYLLSFSSGKPGSCLICNARCKIAPLSDKVSAI